MNVPSLQDLLEAGVHFGHQVRRGNPRMRQYIYGQKDGVHIIDLTLSEKYLKEAVEFVKEAASKGQVILFVGTKKQAKPIVEELAQKIGAPYMTERWIGGFLTNFDEIYKNIKKLKELQEQKEKGTLAKYTKKEQLLLDRKMMKLTRDFKGAMDLTTIPDIIFVVDAASDAVAVKEAARREVKVVAIADSNCDPSLIDYPIPGNDDAIKSIRILTSVIVEAIEEGQRLAGKALAKKQEETQKAEETAMLDAQVALEAAAIEEEVEKKVLKEQTRIVE